MKNQSFFLLTLAMLLWGRVIGQTPLAVPTTPLPPEQVIPMFQNPDISYFDLKQLAINSYNASTDSVQKARLAKKFRRWDFFYRNKIDAQGGLTTYREMLNHHVDGPDEICSTGGDWKNIGPFDVSGIYSASGCDNDALNGRIESIEVIEDAAGIATLYAGAKSGGLWRTTRINGVLGTDWVCLTDNTRAPIYGVNHIAVDPVNTNTIWIASNYSGVYVTNDGGVTWTRSHQLGVSSWYAASTNKLLIDPDNHNQLFLTHGNQIMKRKETSPGVWEWVTMNVNYGNIPSDDRTSFCDIEILPGNHDIMFATTTRTVDWVSRPSKVYFSVDRGESWALFNNQPLLSISDVPRMSLAVTPNDPLAVYCAVLDGTDKIFRLDATNITANSTWSLISSTFTPALSMDMENAFEINPFNPANNLFYLGGLNLGGTTVLKTVSINSGVSTYSTVCPRHADIRYIKVLDINTILCGHDGGISISSDAGNTWTSLNGNTLNGNKPLSTNLHFGFDNSDRSDVLITGTLDNGNLGSLNAGASWEMLYFGGDGFEAMIDDLNPLNIYAGGNSGFGISADGGVTFPSSTPNGVSGIGNSQIAQSRALPGVIFFERVIGINHQVIKRASATSEIPISNFTIDKPMKAIAVSHTDPLVMAVVFADSDYKLWITTDGGQNWTDQTHKPGSGYYDPQWGQAINDIIIDPEKPYRMWITSDKFGWVDATTNWTTNGQGRVWETNDYGTTWTDISYNNGLPPFPIRTIECQEGTNGVLYVGTDIGIYRYNPDNQTWNCFNNGLPNVEISELRINHCKGIIQAATFGRGIWESPLAPVTTPYTITQNTTWDVGSYHNGSTDIVIKSPARLTVRGQVNMGEGTKITVEPGAELLVDGGTITNMCGLMWGGIDVVGNKNLAQYVPGAQGKVTLKNGASIENAIDAVSLWDAESQDPNTAGGILKATNTTFLNNWRDVEFIQYTNHDPFGQVMGNLSYFEDCRFVLDNDYRGDNVGHRVTLWDVNKINFKACSFLNQNTTLPNKNHNMYALYSMDAGFNLVSQCNSTVSPCPDINIERSKIENFSVGIRADRGQGTNTFTVDHTDFINNGGGILSQAVNNEVITNNFFEVGAHNFLPASWWHFGLAISTGSQYKVENNSFEGRNNTERYGTFLYDTGTDDNMIYRNDFSDLYVGNASYGTNRGTSLPFDPGLQYNCNDHSNNLTDIYVMKGAGIRYFQGDGVNQVSAQNTHTQLYAPEGDYTVTADNPVEQLYDPNTPNTEALYYTTSLFVQTPANPNSCEPEIKDPYEKLGAVEKTQLSNDFTTEETAFQNLKYAYTALIDGGNTELLKENVSEDWSDDAWQMRNGLIAKSPNLSMEVILEAANTGVLPDAMLFEILLANLDVAKNPKLMTVLTDNIPNPLPTYMANIVLGATKPVTLRGTLEKQLAARHANMSNIAYTLIDDILKDGTADPTAHRYWLDKLNTPHSRYLYAESQLEQGLTSDAVNTVAGMPAQYAYSEKYQAEQTAYFDLMNFKAAVKQSGRNWKQLTETELDFLRDLAYDTKADAAIQARNILCFAVNECDSIPSHPMPTTAPLQQRISKPFSSNTNDELKMVSIYPNPATDYVTFDYDLGSNIEKSTIWVYDALGALMSHFEVSISKGQVLWDIRNIPAGLYSLKLTSEKGFVLYSDKFSIVK